MTPVLTTKGMRMTQVNDPVAEMVKTIGSFTVGGGIVGLIAFVKAWWDRKGATENLKVLDRNGLEALAMQLLTGSQTTAAAQDAKISRLEARIDELVERADMWQERYLKASSALAATATLVAENYTLKETIVEKEAIIAELTARNDTIAGIMLRERNSLDDGVVAEAAGEMARDATVKSIERGNGIP